MVPTRASPIDLVVDLPVELDVPSLHSVQTELRLSSPTMKLTVGLTTALVGFAAVAAAQPAAQVYILPATESTSTPSVSRGLARLILLQRLAPIGKGPSFHDIPADVDTEEAVSLLNKYGKAPPRIFGGDDVAAPSQLVVMLEGMTEEQIKDLGSALQGRPAFTIADPPAMSANKKFFKYDAYNAGTTNEHECSIDRVANPFDKACWSGKSTIAKYNIQKVRIFENPAASAIY